MRIDDTGKSKTEKKKEVYVPQGWKLSRVVFPRLSSKRKGYWMDPRW